MLARSVLPVNFIPWKLNNRIKKLNPQKSIGGLCFEFGVLFSFMIKYNSMKIFLLLFRDWDEKRGENCHRKSEGLTRNTILKQK